MTTAVALGALAATVVPAAAPPAGAVAPADATVFINEIHYDDSGLDEGEAIEVAGTAGTDLSGWELVLYNGSNGKAYRTTSLAGVLPDQGAGFGTTVVTYPVNGIQNGAPDAVALVDAGGTVVQLLSYEGAFTAADGPASRQTSTSIGAYEPGDTPEGRSLQLRGTGRQYGDFAWAAPAASSFGTLNAGQVIGDPEPERDPCTIHVTHEIGAVQGDGFASPLAGEVVTVDGVVVGDFQAPGELGGVYLQDPDGDGDAATSDGIFIDDADAPDVAAGDLVRVTGTADERYGLTQLTDVTSIGDCGDGTAPAPADLHLPAISTERERLEGMLVTLDEPVTATETYDLGRYGELVVSADARLFQPSNGGSDDDVAEQAANDARRIVIDDGSSVQNPVVVPFTNLDDDGQVIRLGDTVTDVVGVLSYGFGAWRIQPTDEPTVERTNPRPQAPDAIGGDVQVASFNVLNYFTTLDGRTDTDDDPRGADTAAELVRQQAKIVDAMIELDVDVLGLMEIENDVGDEALLHLLDALNHAAGEERYAAIEEPDTGDGLFGTDAIKVAMIYRPDAVVPMGPSATTYDDAFANARLPLAQRFRPVGGGQPFTVVVNHFKSKGCGGAAGANADQGDGHGCYNADRIEQAEALLDLLDEVNAEDALIVGDLNAYGEEDPIDVLRDAGYVDLVDTRLPEDDQYSYVFQGQAGYLDHALVSPRLARRVTGVDIWHINADEARILDYNTEFNPDWAYAADAYRSSDHDPVLVGIAGQHGDLRRRAR